MKKVEFFVEMLSANQKDWHRISSDPQLQNEQEAREFLAECKQDAADDGMDCQHRIVVVTTSVEVLA